MATNQTEPTDRRSPPSGTVDRREVFIELFEELGAHPRGVHANRMAESLIRYESAGRELLGVFEGLEYAAVYCANARTLLSVPFDAHGVDEAGAIAVDLALDDPTDWLRVRGGDLVWTHPRYRDIVAAGGAEGGAEGGGKGNAGGGGEGGARADREDTPNT